VTPTSIRNSWVGNPLNISLRDSPPKYTPMTQAKRIPKKPTLILAVKLRRTATASAHKETTARFIEPFSR
jgi:hypothetical protein